MLRSTLSLSKLVILDGLRRHALAGLILFTIALECCGLFFFEFIPRDIGRASTDFILSIGWLAGFLFLLFHAVQAMAWDEEHRTIHTLLARPISRTQYVFGMFAGLAALVFILNVVLGTIGYGILSTIKNSVAPLYFEHLSMLGYLLAWIGLYCIELMILSVIVIFSGLVRGGFPVLLITVAYFFICSGLPIVRTVFQTKEADINFLQKFLKGMTFVFPDFGRFDLKKFAIEEKVIFGLQHLVADGFLLVTYTTIILCCAALVYQHRDLK